MNPLELKMRTHKIIYFLFLTLAVLTGCGPSKKEIDAKGFSSAEEMKQYQLLGYDSKNAYVAKSYTTIGKNLIENSFSQGRGRPTLSDIESNVFSKCRFNAISELSAKSVKNCSFGNYEKLSNDKLLGAVNIVEDIVEVAALQIIHPELDDKSILSIFNEIDGVSKEPVQCEFIDSESTASNNINVNIISFKGIKKFTVKEESIEIKGKYQRILTIYYNTSKNCKVLQERQALISPVFDFTINPVFDDPSLPEIVRAYAIDEYRGSLASLSIEKIPDMNHDGYYDYIVTGGSGYCGSAGCSQTLIQSVKQIKQNAGNIGYTKTFSGYFHEIKFTRNPKSKIIFSVASHGSNCGKIGAQVCHTNYVFHKNKYMSEDDYFALTSIIPFERAAYCAFVNGRIFDKLKRYGGKNDIQNFKKSYLYFDYYREYMLRNHIQKYSTSYFEKLKSQIFEIPEPTLYKDLAECNKDRRVTEQRPPR